MEQTDITNRIKKIIAKYAKNINDSDFDITQDLISLGIDSGNVLKIVVDIENEFDFEFDDEDLTAEKLQSAESIINYIKQLPTSKA